LRKASLIKFNYGLPWENSFFVWYIQFLIFTEVYEIL